MAGLLMFFVLAGFVLRVTFVHVLARPLFWIVLALVLLIGLPLVVILVCLRV